MATAGEHRASAALVVLPACFLVETILGGPFGIYGGLPVRFLLLGGSCGLLLVALLLQGRIVGDHAVPLLSVLGFLLLNGCWIAVVPALTGTKLYWALREPHAFIVVVLVVLALARFGPAQLAPLLVRLQRLVVVVSLVLATIQVGLWIVGTLVPGLRWGVPLALGAVFGGTDQLFVGEMEDGFFRVFWISTLWCLLSFFWISAAFPRARLLRVWQMLLLMDLFVAYSRGIWIGLVVGLVVGYAATITRENAGRVLARFTLAGALSVVILVAVLAASGSLDRGLARLQSTTSREDVSIGARVEQAPYLLGLWYDHPLVGSGYGAYAHGNVRSQEAPYSYEHMPYALLAKLGLLGMVGSGLFFAGWGVTAWEARRREPAEVASFLGGASALLVAEMTNPMVLNFVSMTIFACLLIQWAVLFAQARQR